MYILVGFENPINQHNNKRVVLKQIFLFFIIFKNLILDKISK